MALHTSSLSWLLYSMTFVALMGKNTANPLAPANATTASTTRLGRIIFDDKFDFDYETESAPVSTAPPPVGPIAPCDYDRCRDGQVPCEELRKNQSCLCPGVSGPNVVPEFPRILEITQQGSTVNVHWCAPPSTVEKYQVVYSRQGKGMSTSVPLERGSQSRTAQLEDLSDGVSYVVCVQAINRAGSSPLKENSNACAVYKSTSEMKKYLYPGLIGGVLLLLFFVVIGVILIWRHHTNRKRPTDVTGLTNPSFSRGSRDETE
ncbi:LRRN4 C-terminal-like protein [Erpetoichthys calabaricus]|uniref:LRRN4 C-terminal-like protein n=1 Tax=Erpetoichthys calabaricus TaxID=27687 RepID=UPI0010A08E7C|nr:LRRN4 C-terminal-like protein [Erpetoichthys calabaricus]